MEISVNAVKFRADEKLLEFINKKLQKVETLLPQAIKSEVNLKVDKEQAELNKIADVRIFVKGYDLFASKQCDTFEEAIDECLDAIRHQIEKMKDKLKK